MCGRLSANQIIRYFKLKSYMRYQVDFLLPLKLQKISYYFGLCWKILLVNQFAGFFTFDLFDLLILIPRDHCDIALLFWHVWRFQGKYPNIIDRYPLHVQQFLHNWNFSKYFPIILCNKNMTAKVCTIFTKNPLANVNLLFVAKVHHFIARKSWNHIFYTFF